MSNVRIEHARACGYCRKGIKKFCERHGLDWNTFLTEGIPEEELLSMDDLMATKTVEHMKEQDEQS